MHKCIYCGTRTKEKDRICKTYKWKIEVSFEEEKRFQEIIKERLRKKKNFKKSMK